ncbi:ABC transporter permease [Glutamicibacter uratoxydans]|uniref:ABC transporter permease n=1 Tax=Glutamicibacter uratoxydans TaxID=43667 RepID=UPI003D6FD466
MSTPALARHVLRADQGAFSGTGKLVLLILRFSRRSLICWTGLALGITWYTVSALEVVFADPEALRARAAVIGLPAAAMLSGPGYGLEDYSVPAMMANELLGAYAVFLAILCLRQGIVHTRAAEEAGRADLIGALPVARLAPLTAALIVVLCSALAVCLAVCTALLLSGFDPAGALLCVSGLFGVGLVFGAVGVFCAQLSSSTRTAFSLSVLVLAFGYLLRAAGDASELGGSLLSWLSPFGWAQQTRVFVQARAWPLLLYPVLILPLLSAAYLLQSRREIGAGLLPTRLGRDRARTMDRTLLGVSLRLERTRMITWLVALFIAAAMNGSLARPVAEALRDVPALQPLLGVQGDAALEELVLATLAVFLALTAMAAGLYAVQSPHRLRQDEALGRGGLLLAGPVTRYWLLGTQLLVCAAGCVLLCAAAGAGLGLGAQPVFEQPVLGLCVLASLAFVPLLWCWLALAFLAYGLRHGGLLVWLGIVACIVVGIYGALLNIPQQLIDLEPFTALDVLAVARGQGQGWVLVGYLLAAVLLAAAAMAAFRRRNVGS